jgi:hypothetical protein
MDGNQQVHGLQGHLAELEKQFPVEENLNAWGILLRGMKTEAEKRSLVLSKAARIVKQRKHVPPKSVKNMNAASGIPKNLPPTTPKDGVREPKPIVKNMNAATGLPKNPPPTYAAAHNQEVPPPAPVVEVAAPTVSAPGMPAEPVDLVSAEGVVVEQGKPTVGAINVPETDVSTPPPAAE